VTVREAEAEIIQDLTRRILAGESQNALVRDLNARGILTSHGNPWGWTSTGYARCTPVVGAASLARILICARV